MFEQLSSEQTTYEHEMSLPCVRAWAGTELPGEISPGVDGG